MGLYRNLKMKLPWKQKRLKQEREKQERVAARAIEIIGKKTPPDGKAVFIDCGFNTRTVFDYYYKGLGNRFEYVGFEIQPSLWQQANDSDAYQNPPVEFIHAGVSSKEGTVYYYEPRKWFLNYKGGATILEEKQDREMDKVSTPIDTINFSEFIAERYSRGDFIVVKMDIEGAEYDVLQKMIADDTLAYVDVLFVEFHSQYLKPTPEKNWEEIHKFVIEKLEQAPTVYYDWI